MERALGETRGERHGLAGGAGSPPYTRRFGPMTTSHPLSGQTALVTGGTRGIGRAVAASLLEAGAEVVLTGTRREAAEEAAEQLNAGSASGACAYGAACDVTSDQSVAALLSLVRDRWGRLDILVNNAGVGIYHPTPELSLDDFRTVVETNLIGVFRVTKAFLPFLLASGEAVQNDAPSGATVVNIGSLAGRHPFKAAPPTTHPNSGSWASPRP